MCAVKRRLKEPYPQTRQKFESPSECVLSVTIQWNCVCPTWSQTRAFCSTLRLDHCDSKTFSTRFDCAPCVVGENYLKIANVCRCQQLLTCGGAFSLCLFPPHLAGIILIPRPPARPSSRPFLPLFPRVHVKTQQNNIHERTFPTDSTLSV